MDFGIIAAGKGQRLNEADGSIKKPLVEVCGVPILIRLISILQKTGAKSVSIIINQEMADIESTVVKECSDIPCKISFLIKSTPSSFHSFYELCKFMNPREKFVITTVDSIFLQKNFQKYLDYFSFAEQSVDGVMGVSDFIDDEKPLYVSYDDSFNITGFHDTTPNLPYAVSGGIYGLTPTCFPLMEECMSKGVNRLRAFQKEMVISGLNLKAFNLGKIIDIDRPQDIIEADKWLNEVNCGQNM